MNTVVSVEIVHMVCGQCGTHFGMDRSQYDLCQKRNEHFYCTRGHRRIFIETELDKLRAEKLRLESRLDYVKGEREAARKEVVAQKGRATRFKNDRDRIKLRIANGVCPCCNRHFVNVERHMATKHPHYSVPEADA